MRGNYEWSESHEWGKERFPFVGSLAVADISEYPENTTKPVRSRILHTRKDSLGLESGLIEQFHGLLDAIQARFHGAIAMDFVRFPPVGGDHKAANLGMQQSHRGKVICR